MGDRLLPSAGIEGLLSALRCSGHKITQARRAVIEIMAESRVHLSASDLIVAVQERAPGVGRASVYRTLELLTGLGMVQCSTLGSSSMTYLLTPNGHHHHVVCLRCQRTVEFDECVLQDLEGQLADALGFKLEGHLVEIYGHCPECLG